MSQWVRSKHDWQLSKFSIKDRFKELLSLSQWTDCSFLVGEENVEKICCHKLVLAASSPVFEALFFGGFSEPTDVIKVPDVEPHIFRLFLDYIYSDTLDLGSIEEAGGLLYVGKKYIMPQLSDVCLVYIKENTRIRTLWDVLAIAEALDEDDLISVCIKVMSWYPFEIWSTGDNHLSKHVLLRLLEHNQMNMKDVDLFRYSLKWAENQCMLEGSNDDPNAIRNCLSSFGALSKIRFLSFTPREFSEIVVPSGVLTEDECDEIKAYLYGYVDHSDPYKVPLGLSSVTDHRSRVAPLVWKCTREVSRGDRLSTYVGPVKVGITSTSRVLITGFEIVTRQSPMRSPTQNRILNTYRTHPSYYRQRLVAFIEDPNHEILSKTDIDSNVEFNSHQLISLSRPVWFESGVQYIVHFEFSHGNYPLSHYADTVLAKGTTFIFDSLQWETIDKGGFIHSVLYSY